MLSFSEADIFEIRLFDLQVELRSFSLSESKTTHLIFIISNKQTKATETWARGQDVEHNNLSNSCACTLCGRLLLN